ncbi:polyprenyl synthetase family protein [Galbitalea sp. SE-J8]|uniref:polyprenyl synthetase family protein n=1 Tax=Galbitalea sp. SE-J8 TaxID=3054952 RepID=UPI00259CB602|nr:polyprenyl synthetase family protein [Galbitalea sp. SE-J8]MDM4763075.1 polyprenyl synthetase family protein [Galbitalea sp. SE-J8]
MAESTRLVDLVQVEVDAFLDGQATRISAISPDLDPFVELARRLLRGGKRFRALFCYWGWEATRAPADPLDPLPAAPTDDAVRLVVGAASALELFHAAALVHDDIMDNSDTRRGQPAAHRSFERLHAAGEWVGSRDGFGRAGAILLGDLLLGWSDELFEVALDRLGDPARARAARSEFATMRTEVSLGQYLDLLEEVSWLRRDEAELLSRAQRVIVYKSAKYSVEAPLTIGAALAGADAEQLAALRRFGLPLGIAYQLRDDLLGVFGDPGQTGKPAGDDLREGKRTVLVALARLELQASTRRLFDELLGDPALDDEQIATMQRSIEGSGAVEKVERIIARQVGRAIESLHDAPLSESSKAQLARLAESVTRRAR